MATIIRSNGERVNFWPNSITRTDDGAVAVRGTIEPDPIGIAEEEVRRYRWRDVDENVDRFNAALEEWVRRGEEE